MAETATADPPTATSSGSSASSHPKPKEAGPEGTGAGGSVPGVVPPPVVPPKEPASDPSPSPVAPPPVIPADLPRAVRPEFKPDFNPKVTHDLRTYKPEVDHAGLLAPRKLGDAMSIGETVSIPKGELDRLQANADIRKLLVNFSESECTAAESDLLARVSHQLNGVPLPGTEPAPTAPAPHLDEEPTKKPKTQPAVIAAVVAMVVLLMGGIGYFTLAHTRRQSTPAPASAAAQPSKALPPAPRSFYVALNAPNLAVKQALGLAHNNIIWLTSDPMDPHIWDILDTIRHQSGIRVTLIAATDSVSPDELTAIAREHDLTTCQATLSLGHVNWFLIDDHYLLDADGTLIAPFSADPNDAAHAINLVRTKITPSLHMLYESRPVAAVRR